ncbi:acyl-CoA dehydrogenase family protein [Chloroflexota bacterium]
MFPSPFMSTVVLCGQLLLAAGSDEQKKELLPKIVDGSAIMALAFNEPESSWNRKDMLPEGITLSATADGDSYVLNGTKLFVHDANSSDYMICVARTKSGSNPEDGITLFLVDSKDAGITCTTLDTSANNNKICEVVFDKVKVPAANIIGKLNEGWAPLWKAIQIGAVMLCAEMVGAGQSAQETTVDYTKTRIQFDMPIGIHQFVQEHVVQQTLAVDGSRRVTYLAAWMLSEGLPCDLEVAIAKAWTNEYHEEGLWRSHQVLAGVSSTEALGVMPMYSKRGNIQCLYLGDADFWKEKITEELEKLPPPQKGKAPARGLWKPGLKQEPTWDIWRDYVESLEKKDDSELDI